MRPELKFGLITGLAVCLWILAEFLLGLHTTRLALGQYTGLLSNLIPLTTLFLLLKGKRDSAGGELTLAHGITAGMVASLTAALIVYSFLVAYHQLINPSWVDQTLQWKVQRMRAAQESEEAIRAHITAYRNTYSPAGMVATVIVGMTLMGGIFSLGLTLLLRLLPHPPRA